MRKSNGLAIVLSIENSIATNAFLYTLSKIPLAGRLVKVRHYSDERYKTWYKILSRILPVLKFLTLKGLYLAVVWVIASLVSHQFKLPYAQVGIILWTILLILGTTASTVFEDSKTKWRMIQQFRMAPDTYYQISLRKQLLSRSVYALMCGIAVFIAGGAWYHIGWSLVLPLGGNVMMDAYLASNFKKTGLLPKYGFRTLSTLKVLPLLVIVLIPHFEMGAFVLLSTGVAIGGWKAFKMLMCMSGFQEINIEMRATLKLSTDITVASLEMAQEELRIDEDANGLKSRNAVDTMGGYRLMNTLFFNRHRRMWLKPLRYAVRTVVVLGIGMIVGVLGFNRFAVPTFDLEPIAITTESIASIQNILIMSLYGINVAPKITRACFLNCDYSLLHYAFYRRKETIWKQYVVRVLIVMAINLVPVFAFMGVLVVASLFGVVVFTSGYTLALLTNLLMFSLFFSTIYFFMYYMFQPFNSKMEAKSIVYSIIIFMMYYLSLYSNHITNLENATPIIIGVVVGFLALSTLAVRFLGEKTFKLRE